MVASGAPAPPQDGEPANPGNAPPGTEASGGPAVANGRPPGVLQLQKQLDLTEDQMKDIDQIIARHRKDHDRKAGFAELEKILTPEQKAKWDAMRAEAMKRPPNQPRIKGGP
jgi:Spy/CpxP family protein refolding chaperone